ncbi:MAG TPA: c-type cytochrome [Planctomycetota bacterium]|nr:c-type cytochrome [Planctomycetota bacterium]
MRVTPLVLLSLLLAGCSESPSSYPPGPELAKMTDPALKAKVEANVARVFGSPEDLRAPKSTGLEMARVTLGHELYRGMCLHCHGEFGDGKGPAAVVMDPAPRDFRRGIFKFTSTPAGVKPVRADIVATLRRGMPLGKMPSFAALEEDRLDQLAEYVVFLAMRGEYERKLAAHAEEDGELEDKTADDQLASVAESWTQATAQVVTPVVAMPALDPPTIARGRELFLSATVNCQSCHGPEGKGNGPGIVGLKDDWDHPITPRDLTLGIYRGGSRPLDLFRTICCGVKGTPMPSFASTLPPEDIWALALYVKTLGAPRSPVW